MPMYLRNLNIEAWTQKQAPTQFLGEGSSHDLAAHLLTELDKHFLHVLKTYLGNNFKIADRIQYQGRNKSLMG